MRLPTKLITIFAAFILAMLLVLRFWVLPQLYVSANQAASLRLAQSVIRFQKDHGFVPGIGTGEAATEQVGELPAAEKIVAALRGGNESKKNYLDDFPEDSFKDGEVLDTYGKPFKFELGKDGLITVRSAGANGKFGDGDDVTDRTE